jgi:DNA-binding transcriptional ArsR family regulator
MAEAKQRLEELEAVFTALAHPARRQILLTVWFRGGVLSSGDINARFGHAWPTTVRHLRVLEAAGLLTHEKDGRCVFYRVNQRKLDIVREWLRWFDPEAEKPAERKASRQASRNIEAGTTRLNAKQPATQKPATQKKTRLR